ncbi:hypothetical protein ERJ75_000871400 [Trypanosoma vivax]|nr:hypothetical protein ERJ75_000871400 [Trypanosoma vivax]
MQRGEVRRRASILLKREGCPEPELTAAGDHGDRTPAGSATLERVMKEELEGLELWLRASRGATSPFLPCHPATGLPVSTARKRSPAVVCDHRECERLHARAFALVSALLIHLYPMQQAMVAMEPKLWEGALYNLKKTLWKEVYYPLVSWNHLLQNSLEPLVLIFSYVTDLRAWTGPIKYQCNEALHLSVFHPARTR